MNKWITCVALSTALVAGAAFAEEPKTPGAAAPAAVLNVASTAILKPEPAQGTAAGAAVKDELFTPRSPVAGAGINHYSSLPGLESGVIVQANAQFPGQERAVTAGEAWRQYRNGPLSIIGAGLLAAALFVLALLYFINGPIQNKEPNTGRLIERFTPAERAVHWTVAITFVLLAVTGLVMLFGKYLLLPILGHTLFGWLGYLCKNVHNFVGPLFTVSIVAFFVMYVRDNLPAKPDVGWLLHFGGLFGGKEPSSYRFNAGEKIWFWGGLVLLGLIVSASGFVLDMIVPGMAYPRSTMQIANIAHVLGTTIMMAGAIGHIYLGTVGMVGAYDGMRHGYVDDTWAKEHHDLWYEQVQSGEIPRIRSQQNADAAPATLKA